jgi:hypothetical protein
LLRRSIRPEAGIFVITIDELCIEFNWILMFDSMLAWRVPLVSIVIIVVVNSTEVIARRRRRLRHLGVFLPFYGRGVLLRRRRRRRRRSILELLQNARLLHGWRGVSYTGAIALRAHMQSNPLRLRLAESQATGENHRQFLVDLSTLKICGYMFSCCWTGWTRRNDKDRSYRNEAAATASVYKCVQKLDI